VKLKLNFMIIKLYLLAETEKARHYQLPKFHQEVVALNNLRRDIWIPRSVIIRQTKYPATPYPLCMVEIQDWFGKQEGLDRFEL